MVGTILLTSAAAAAATGIPQYFEGKKAARKSARAQEQANAISEAGSQVENARRRRKAIAQARIANATNVAAQSQAVDTSSQLSGVQASLGTQLGANIGAQSQMIGNQRAIQGFQQQSADALRKGQERVSLLNAIGETTKQAASAAAGGAGGTVPFSASSGSSLQPTFAAQSRAISQGNNNFVL